LIFSRCLCGTVSIEIEARPTFIHDCNCSLCRKAGAAWGYFAPNAVSIRGHTRGFSRADKAEPSVSVHSCTQCAATTHFVLTDAFRISNPGAADCTGVNMRLFNGPDLEGAEVRFPDGAAWDGKGGFGYRRDAFTIKTDAQL
jgi:hypothetical protein